MADKLPNPREMRAKARQHREAALQTKDVQSRRLQLRVADEYDLLADAIEAELGEGEAASRPVKS
jgi:hypothetical protein